MYKQRILKELLMLILLMNTISVNAQIERKFWGNIKFGMNDLDVYYAFKSAGYSTHMTNIGKQFYVLIDNVNYFAESWEMCVFQSNGYNRINEVDFITHSYDKNDIDKKYIALQNYFNKLYPTCEKVNGHIRSEYIKSYGIKDKKTFLVLEEFNNVIRGGYGLILTFYDLKRCRFKFNK